MILNERQYAVLRLFRDHQYVTQSQVRRILYPGIKSRSSIDNDFKKLFAGDLIRVVDKEQKKGGRAGGSGPLIWGLDRKGRKLFDLPATRVPWGKVEHCVDVSEFIANLYAQQELGLLTVKHYSLEKTFYSGSRKVVVDAHVIVGAPDRADLECYVEVDRRTQHNPVIIEKMERYDTFQASDPDQRMPRVVFATRNPVREEELQEIIRKSDYYEEDRAYRRFWTCTLDGFPDSMR